MKLSEGPNSVQFKGKVIPDGCGFYANTSMEFFRGPLSNMSRTLKASCTDAAVNDGGRLRLLTGTECLRLMGVRDCDIPKITRAVQEAQQKKLAGNSIVCDVMIPIFKKLFNANDDISDLF